MYRETDMTDWAMLAMLERYAGNPANTKGENE